MDTATTNPVAARLAAWEIARQARRWNKYDRDLERARDNAGRTRVTAVAGAEPTVRRRRPPSGTMTTGMAAAGLVHHAYEPPFAPTGRSICIEVHSNQRVRINPFSGYGTTNLAPNMTFVGDSGSGKTLTCQLLLDGFLDYGYIAAAIEAKITDGKGDLTRFAERHGYRVHDFDLNSDLCINVLDPAFGMTSTVDTDLTSSALLDTIVVTALSRLINGGEKEALRAAHRNAVARANTQSRVAILEDVAEAIFAPTKQDADAVRLTIDEFVDLGREIGYELRALLKSDLGRLINGVTNVNIDNSSPLNVFNLAHLPATGITRPIAMTTITTYIHAMYARRPGKQILLIDEAQELLNHTGTAMALASSMSTARGQGRSHWAATQNVRNLTDERADPELTRAVNSVFNGAETILAFSQQGDQIEELARRREIDPTSIASLASLPQGEALLITPRRPVVHLRVTPTPTQLAEMNSDHGMKAGQ